MKNFLFLILTAYLSFYATSSNGQKHSIKGFVKSTKNEALAYATVSIKGKQIGVITNEEGAFSLYYPELKSSDTLSVNIIGYHSKEYKVTELPKDGVFKLKQAYFAIDEVKVKSKNKLKSIMKQAKKNLKRNFPKEGYTLHADFQNYIEEDSSFVRAFEASVKIKDYTTSMDAREKIDSVRCLVDNISHKNKKYHRNQVHNTYSSNEALVSIGRLRKREKYTLIDVIEQDNDKIYLVSWKTEYYDSKYWIRLSDCFILKHSLTQLKPLFISPHAKEVNYDLLDSYNEIRYTKDKDTYYPIYLYEFEELRYRKKGEELYHCKEHNRLYITKKENGTSKKFPDKYKDDYYRSKKVFNTWNNYNGILNDSLRIRALKELKLIEQ